MRVFASNPARSHPVGMHGLRANSMRAGVLLVLGLVASNLHAQTLTTLYSFTGGNDGNWPYAGLTLNGSSLYGATQTARSRPGTVFSIATSGGSLTTLLSLSGTSGAAPGADPCAGLTLNGSTLYGTTAPAATAATTARFSALPPAAAVPRS